MQANSNPELSIERTHNGIPPIRSVHGECQANDARAATFPGFGALSWRRPG
jgi:hypothetical protein